MPRYLTALIKTRLRVVIVISLCFGLLTLASVIFPSRSRARVNPQETAPGKRLRARYVPGEVLVRYKSESQARNRQGGGRVTTRQGLDIPVQVERLAASNLIEGLRLARVPADQTLRAVAALKTQPDVLYAEPNYLYKAARLPNDPFFNDTGMSKINAQVAWDTQTGSRSVVVAVLDQGIDISHEDLAANIWTNPAPGSIPGFTNDLHGYNFIDNSGNVFSGNPNEDHATHVAGTIGAVGDNGKGVMGVNWAVSLMSLKFLDIDTFGEAKHALDACTYAKAMRDKWIATGGAQGANIRVINASFGGGPYSHLFEDAVSKLNDSGIMFVAAAGNFDPATSVPDTLTPNNDLVPQYPANFNGPNMISVAATDGADQRANFSHYGALTVDLGAPGVSILSTTPGNTYTKFNGTSMAAPHVSGSAALLWAQNPNLTVQQVKNLLLLNGDVSSDLTDHTLTGRRLDVGKSFQSLLENDTTAPGTVTGFNISSQTGRTLNLSWNATGDDGGTGLAKLDLIDYVDGSTGAVITLKSVIPASAGTPQSTTVNIPFGHPTGTLRLRAIDNAGNEGTPATLPINIPVAVGDP
jgi:subtilisin family serine protease